MAATRRTATRARVVRKTGTRRTTARGRTARRKAAAGVAAKALRIAGVSSDAVLRATGKAWAEWLKVLDRAGAKAMAHKDIAMMLSRKFSVPSWWSQMVSVGYEQARGLRAPNQTARGYSAHASRTVDIGLDKLYTAWSEPMQRSRWLPDAPLEIRKSVDRKSMRITWTAGGTEVDVSFAAKGPGKSMVAIEHGKLTSAAAVKRQKAYWGEALGRLKSMLEGPH
jgi:hypothetical protein